ncbi:hypothetical protein LTR37_004684 [Vermiconidia calcicola]|uniref:Uncharacterized protein n=1 Tax=Vermiconidia calcicola TaxID=1690605 RepID=A0ACC3NLW6_9PEZI|nr:hypothetical protein LTR37_004684 [Vermiconidia calcicola]
MNQTDPATITSDAHFSHQDNHCYLLELPAELRDEIFALALYCADGITINLESGTEKKRTSHPLALTMTCKQVQQECGKLFSEVNEVTIQLPLLKWAQQIAPGSELPVYREPIRRALEMKVSTTLRDKNIPTIFRCLRVDISEYGLDCINRRSLNDIVWKVLPKVIDILGNDRMQLWLCCSLHYFGEVVIYDFPVDNSEQYIAAVDECFYATKFKGPCRSTGSVSHAGNLIRPAVSEIQVRRERGWSGAPGVSIFIPDMPSYMYPSNSPQNTDIQSPPTMFVGVHRIVQKCANILRETVRL